MTSKQIKKTARILGVLCLIVWTGSNAESAEVDAPSQNSMKGRINLGLSVGAVRFNDDDEVQRTVGVISDLSYGMTDQLALMLEYADLEDLTAFVLGLEYRFRVNKRMIPHLQLGYGFYSGQEGPDVFDARTDFDCPDFFLIQGCIEKVDSNDGLQLGAGILFFFSQNRRWAFDINFQYAFLNHTAVTVTRTSAQNPTTVTTREFDLSQQRINFGFLYSFN